MELILDINKPFNLEYSLDSGQLFRWTEEKNWRVGLINDTVIKIKKIFNDSILPYGSRHKCSTEPR